MPTEAQHRSDIIHWSRLGYEKGFLDGASGNLSIRLPGNRLLITPGGVSKGRLRKTDLIKCDLATQHPVGASNRKPSSEIRMHAFIYRQRADVGAILHAHPVYAVALSLAGVSLEKTPLPESIFALGSIATCPYATPTTRDVVDAIRSAVSAGRQAMILERHGSITLGQTLQEAYARLESLEHVARVTAIARSLGKVTGLSKKEIRKIESLK
jgi:L-fuculose-phosphate aldolase